VDLTGVDFFDRVTVVNLIGSSRPADTTLAEVGRLNQLQSLWLNDASLTDAGLMNLKGLTNLSMLGLDYTQITDAGLVHLKGLTNLKELGLSGTRVTDAGVDELKRSLPSLRIDH
jgi:Leucine-rich repeat (LRR) protein